MTETVDMDHLRGWIGREEAQVETVTKALIERFEATIGRALHREADAAPLAIHWCLAPPAVAPEGLGPDGHPARGGFLPPVPLPRRMWAGGAMTFLRPLKPGDVVTRRSRIADIVHKTGRSGELVFVTVAHDIIADGEVAVSERQDIVYRPMDAAKPTPVPDQPRVGAHSISVDATTTLLFRYSALTFNGHRIHYDVDYARSEEGYPGLVVHGPLQATLMLHLAARLSDGRPVATFSYRGVSPLFHGPPFTVNADDTDDGFDLWCADRQGRTTMQAQATF
ncbi:MaoC family dehydratase N-terminal domain-containing protein [Rhizobium sp. EC-SD404]|uniref:FAS1-like dehydratase domain-containing protein n=1 Tax=Rhizobium sp. EC-SD404 TaxID=2038389 RepID=UPI00125C434C|nr:MaoC family dehydratase N-terminal domain-containing protein [Rhizobium sp. EC-SD404]VVS98650.1 Mesaconyl-C(4)-CoA hydratase [Rhizobium sp. EC-SD404]